MAKIKTLYLIGSDPWSKKIVGYLSCKEGKGEGDGENIKCSAQNAALFVDQL